MSIYNLFKPDTLKLTVESSLKRQIKLLKNCDIIIRKKAVQALSNSGDPIVVEPLISLLNNVGAIDSYFSYASSIVDTLKEFCDDQDLETLVTLATDSDICKFSMYAAQPLKKLVSHPKVNNPITAVLIYREWNLMRATAARALGAIGDIRAVESLIEALKETNIQVRTAVVDNLCKPGDKQVVGLLVSAYLESIDWLHIAAAESLGKIGDNRAVEPLIEACSDADKRVRQTANEALGKISDAQALDLFVDALNNPDFHIRETAAIALGKIGDARAVEPLIAAFKDPELHVYNAAIWAVEKMGIGAMEHLNDALRDSDIYVRKAAAEALNKIKDTYAAQTACQAC